MRDKNVVIGERFHKLVVVKDLGTRGHNNMRWITALCDCGNKKDILLSSLKTGHTKSCGCNKNKRKHGLSKSRHYNIYDHMKSRCYNKKHNNYSYYGGRGITICDEWLGENGFINFYTWAIENGYSDDLTIDRIDNDKGYSPDNCRWATREIQSINQRMQCNNKSGYIGVSYSNERKKWFVTIRVKRKTIALGRYKDIKDAVIARNEYIINNNLPHKLNVV